MISNKRSTCNLWGKVSSGESERRDGPAAGYLSDCKISGKNVDTSMPLSEIATDPNRIHALVADGVNELEAELASLGGLKGKAVSAGYKTVTKVKPEFVPENIRRLVPMCAPALDKHVAEARQSGTAINHHFDQHADTVAEDLLSATDQRATTANNQLAVGVYKKLRPSAKERVIAGMPRLAKLVERHHDAP